MVNRPGGVPDFGYPVANAWHENYFVSMCHFNLAVPVGLPLAFLSATRPPKADSCDSK